MSRANNVLKKVDPRVWTAFVSLKQVTAAGCCEQVNEQGNEQGNEPSCSVGDRVSSLAERLAASRE